VGPAPVPEIGLFVSCGGDEEAHYRERRFAFRACAAVCLLRTQEPTPKEYDSWARAPVSAIGPLFLAQMKGRTTMGGGSLLVVVRLLITRRPVHHLYDFWARALCHRLGCFSACWARFPAVSRGASGSVFLENGFTPRVVVTLLHSFQLLRPFAFEFSMPHCICAPLLFAAVVAVALLVHPERFQSEVALNLVRNMLGWGAPVFVGRICAGASLLGGLTTGEFVLFVPYLSCGLVLPIWPFFLLLLEELGLQHQHLMSHSILQAAIFTHLCEMFVGAKLLSPAHGRKCVVQRPSGEGKRAELRLHLPHELYCLLQRPRQLLPELHQHLVVRLHELVELWLRLSG
jgi:hypothetical protein